MVTCTIRVRVILGSNPSAPTLRLRSGPSAYLYSCYNLLVKLFLSVAGDRTHIGTYVGVSPSPASNGNNFFVLKSYPQFC